jgi:hypothetical protein
VENNINPQSLQLILTLSRQSAIAWSFPQSLDFWLSCSFPWSVHLARFYIHDVTIWAATNQIIASRSVRMVIRGLSTHRAITINCSAKNITVNCLQKIWSIIHEILMEQMIEQCSDSMICYACSRISYMDDVCSSLFNTLCRAPLILLQYQGELRAYVHVHTWQFLLLCLHALLAWEYCKLKSAGLLPKLIGSSVQEHILVSLALSD